MTDHLTTLVESIYKKLPFQKKKFEKHFAKRGEEYYREAEEFIESYLGYLNSRGVSANMAIDAYVKLCEEIMNCQLYFMKTGNYPSDNLDTVQADVYDNEDKMLAYMMGLALSQFLWSTHYDMYKYFSSHINEQKHKIDSYLEIGPGHGLYLAKSIQILGNDTAFTAVDISPTSIEITRSIVEYMYPDHKNISFHCQNMLDMKDFSQYEMITFGEVLEHSSTPGKMLEKLRSLLTDNGKAFISTCVNAPAVDHLHHFRHIDEIKQMLTVNSFNIVDELVLPVEDMPWDELVDKRITINYCATVQKV